jgi:hypothetical protein
MRTNVGVTANTDQRPEQQLEVICGMASHSHSVFSPFVLHHSQLIFHTADISKLASRNSHTLISQFISQVSTMGVISVVVLLVLRGYLVDAGTCAGLEKLCAASTFDAGVDQGNGQRGPNYGCLGSQPNPV